MNLKKHIVFIISFLVVWSTHLFSQEQKYDAVYLKLLKEFTLNPDGSMDYNYQKELKLQTYRSFHNLYGETFVIYHPGFQKLKINEAYTIMNDGKKVITPENAFNDVLPASCANAPAYNALREMVITHTGTERGAVIHLNYTLHTAKDFYPALMGNELISENEPVRDLTIRVRVPKQVPLQFSVTNINLDPVVSEDGTYKIYTWSMKNVPALSMEDFQVSGHDADPRLLFSTAPDRESVYKGFTTQQAFRFEVTDEMKKEISQIRQGNREEIDALLKIQEKVINEFRLWPVVLKSTGFTCRTAKETWNSNGGTLVEKAVLLATLIREAGLDADPVFVIKNSLFDHRIGTFLDIEDIVVVANLHEYGRVFLSVTTLNPQNLRLTLPDRSLVCMKSNGKIHIESGDEQSGRLFMRGNFIISDTKQVEGDLSVNLTRGYDPWLTMMRDQNKLKSFVTGGLAAADLKEAKIITIGSVEAYVRYQVQKEKPFRQDSNYFFYTLPVLTNGVESWGIKLLPSGRETALEIPMMVDESYEFSFVLPKGLKLFSAEKKKEIRNNSGYYLFELKNEGEKVTVTKKIRLLKRTFPKSEYSGFKALVDNWNSAKSKEVIFTEE